MTTIFSVLFTSIADYNLPRLTSVEFSMAWKVTVSRFKRKFEVVRVFLLQWRGKIFSFLPDGKTPLELAESTNQIRGFWIPDR